MDQLTIGEIAKIAKLDRRTVAVKLNEHKIEPVAYSKRNARLYDVTQVLEILKPNPAVSDLSELKAKKLRLEIAQKEFEQAVEREEFVKTDAVRNFWATALKTLLQASNNRLPREIAEKSLQLTEGKPASAEFIQAAVRLVLVDWWHDVRAQNIVVETSTTPMRGK